MKPSTRWLWNASAAVMAALVVMLYLASRDRVIPVSLQVLTHDELIWKVPDALNSRVTWLSRDNSAEWRSKDGAVHWVPQLSDVGQQQWQVQTKGLIRRTTYSIMISVVPYNHEPRLDLPGPQDVPANQPWLCRLPLHDPDGDLLRSRLVQAPGGMTLLQRPDHLVLAWRPSYLQAGAHRVVVEVGDRQRRVRKSLEIKVTADNAPPVFTTLPGLNVTPDQDYIYEPAAYDPGGGTVELQLIQAPGDVEWQADPPRLRWPSGAAREAPVDIVLEARDEASKITRQTWSVVPANVAFTGRVEPTWHSCAYLGDGLLLTVDSEGVRSYHVDAIDKPLCILRLPGQAVIRRLLKVGDYVAVTNNKATGLQLIDARNPFDLRLLTTLPEVSRGHPSEDGTFFCFPWSRKLATMADSQSVAIVREEWPKLGRFGHFEAEPHGGFLYAVNGKEFQVYSLHNPASPELVGACNLGIEYAGRMLFRPPYVYLFRLDKMVVVDIANPAAPRLVIMREFPFAVSSFCSEGDLVWGWHNEDVHAFDFNSPLMPRFLATVGTMRGEIFPTVDGVFRRVGNRLQRLTRENLDEPPMPFPLSPQIANIVRIGSLLFGLSAVNHALYVYDLEDPAHPCLRSRYEHDAITNSRFPNLQAGDGYLATCKLLFDVRDPDHPKLIDQFDGQFVAFHGDMLAIADYNRLELRRIEGDKVQIVQAKPTAELSGRCQQLVADDRAIYAIDDTPRVHTYQLQDGQLGETGVYKVPGRPHGYWGLREEGNTLLLGDTMRDLIRLDCSEPAKLTEVTQLDGMRGTVRELHDGIALVKEAYGLKIIDARSLGKMSLWAELDIGNGASGMVRYGNWLYVVNNYDGIRVYHLGLGLKGRD